MVSMTFCITKNLQSNYYEITHFIDNEIVVIATGPLTSDALSNNIMKFLGQEGLYFYDAAAPIVTKESLDFTKVFYGARYGKGGDDYGASRMRRQSLHKLGGFGDKFYLWQ